MANDACNRWAIAVNSIVKCESPQVTAYGSCDQRIGKTFIRLQMIKIISP